MTLDQHIEAERAYATDENAGFDGWFNTSEETIIARAQSAYRREHQVLDLIGNVVCFRPE